jgi:colicin import membrane protein
MMKLYLATTLLIMPFAIVAGEDLADGEQRARIAVERQRAEALFREQEKACYARFAVNDCLAAAKAHRRQVLADLRRQEVSLNDAQRKRRAAEHLRAVEERSSPEKLQQQAEQRARSLAERQEREAAAARKAADRAARESAAPAKAAERQEREGAAAQKGAGRAAAEASAPAKAAARQEQAARRQAQADAAQQERAIEAAENVQRRQQRLAEVKERRERLDKRLAERKKPAAQPLPAAPAP